MTKARQAKKAGSEPRAAASPFGAAPHDSGEIFRAIFEQAAVGIAVRGVDGRWLQVNQKLCDILGYRREELLAMTSVEITPPQERDQALDYNRRMMRGEISDYSREKRYLRKDGSAVQVNITVKVVRRSDGRPAYIVSVIEDISARKAAEERLRSGFEHLGEMIALTDENDRIVVANRRFREFNARVAEYVEPGRRYDEHLRAGIALGLFPAAAGREEQWIAERMAVLHNPTGPVERERQDGRWLLVDDQRLPDGGGVSFGIEITERKRAEQALRESEERYRRTFELAASGIAHIALDRRFIRVNQRLCEILGYSEAELLRLTGREISYPEDLDVINQQRPRLYAGEIDSVRVEKRYLRKDRAVVWVTVTMVVERDAAGSPLYEIAVFDDITERKRYQVQLEHQANYDTLTGLPNRNLLNDRLRQAVYGKREPRSTAVVFMDLDHFKFVNDSLGHSAGDKLLKGMSERLRSVLREGDTVGRVGGDEFVVILNGQSNEEVIFRAMQRIASRVAEPITIEGKELYVTCSAGISLYPQDGEDVDTLLKNADAAMYRAKEHGRNNFQFYTPEMNERVNERLALENALHRALERQEFVLHYQQKVDLDTGAIIGAEALVRWMHPEWGLVRPARFIPLAEETGIIVQLGEWVLREACRQARAWREAGLDPGVVSVNLSVRQFRQEGLVRTVSRILEETGTEPAQLEMELTESMVMHNAEAAIAILQGLKSLGVALSVDDFGTGYSSLSYLKNLPIDTLKIDRSFVREVGSGGGEDEGVLAQAIISLGHNLHLKVIAEGVETDAQAGFLKRHGCDHVQGFLYGEPVASADYAMLLDKAERKGKRA